jgi:transposase
MRKSKDPKWLRFEMVRYAREHGVKPAARAFQTTPKTVRKWLQRWHPGTLRGLEDRRGEPRKRDSRIDPRQRQRAIGLKKTLKSWGAERIRETFGLTISEKAIRKVWKEAGLLKRKRRKHKTKQDLRAVKAAWKFCEQIDVDTKYLFDIPEYWPQMKRHGLPRYQYTARDVVSGLLFTGYADELSLTYANLFIDLILDHLTRCGVDHKGHRIQTDNGTEFIGHWAATNPSAFTKTIEKRTGLTHHTIPPGAHTYQADVETVHRIMEDEFFEIEPFSSRRNFFNKAALYLLFFNVARKNSYKKKQTPWDIIHQRDPTIKPDIAILQAIDLDDLFKKTLAQNRKREYDIVPYPCF